MWKRFGLSLGASSPSFPPKTTTQVARDKLYLSGLFSVLHTVSCAGNIHEWRELDECVCVFVWRSARAQVHSVCKVRISFIYNLYRIFYIYTPIHYLPYFVGPKIDLHHEASSSSAADDASSVVSSWRHASPSSVQMRRCRRRSTKKHVLRLWSQAGTCQQQQQLPHQPMYDRRWAFARGRGRRHRQKQQAAAAASSSVGWCCGFRLVPIGRRWGESEGRNLCLSAKPLLISGGSMMCCLGRCSRWASRCKNIVCVPRTQRKPREWMRFLFIDSGLCEWILWTV